MRKIESYRRLLDVTKDAELKELKSVYRNLMKDFHPDKFQDNEAEKLAAEEKSKKIIEAYHFLVSIAPETLEASIDQYNETLAQSPIEDFEYKNEKLSISFEDGSCYEYYGVPKAIYSKFVNAPSPARFLRRHISTTYVYRSASKLVAA